MTARELAEATGVSYPAITRYEREGLDNARFGYVMRIADALGVMVYDLYDDGRGLWPRLRAAAAMS